MTGDFCYADVYRAAVLTVIFRLKEHEITELQLPTRHTNTHTHIQNVTLSYPVFSIDDLCNAMVSRLLDIILLCFGPVSLLCRHLQLSFLLAQLCNVRLSLAKRELITIQSSLFVMLNSCLSSREGRCNTTKKMNEKPEYIILYIQK